MFCGSPVPTQRMSGFDGATATAPIEGDLTESKSDVHDTPAFVERQTPPVAAAMYITVPSLPRSATAISVIRPPMSAGPMPRKARPRASTESGRGEACAGISSGDSAAKSKSGLSRRMSMAVGGWYIIGRCSESGKGRSGKASRGGAEVAEKDR